MKSIEYYVKNFLDHKSCPYRQPGKDIIVSLNPRVVISIENDNTAVVKIQATKTDTACVEHHIAINYDNYIHILVPMLFFVRNSRKISFDFAVDLYEAWHKDKELQTSFFEI